MEKIITIANYFQCSTGNFISCPTPETSPTFNSKESKYWHLKEDGDDYIIRCSNHWGIAKNCYWRLDSKTPRGPNFLTGKIRVKDLQFNYKAIKNLKNLLKILPTEIFEEIVHELRKEK